MSFYGFGNTVPSMIDKYIGSEYDNVKKVADNIEDIKEIAGGMDGMVIIVDNIEAIVAVGEDIEDVKTVAENIGDVGIVADNYQDVGLVADAISSNTIVHKTAEDTGAAFMPAGTDAQRPATPVLGMVRYNTEDQGFEGFSGDGWSDLGGAGGSHIGATPPDEVLPGATWYCTTDGLTYVLLDDGDSIQWVEANPTAPTLTEITPEQIGALGNTGDQVLDGTLTVHGGEMGVWNIDGAGSLVSLQSRDGGMAIVKFHTPAGLSAGTVGTDVDAAGNLLRFFIGGYDITGTLTDNLLDYAVEQGVVSLFNPCTHTAQQTRTNSLTRKDYVDGVVLLQQERIDTLEGMLSTLESRLAALEGGA